MLNVNQLDKHASLNEQYISGEIVTEYLHLWSDAIMILLVLLAGDLSFHTKAEKVSENMEFS